MKDMGDIVSIKRTWTSRCVEGCSYNTGSPRKNQVFFRNTKNLYPKKFQMNAVRNPAMGETTFVHTAGEVSPRSFAEYTSVDTPTLKSQLPMVIA